MAFTFGFYNSLNGDRRYNAEQVGEIFDGILRDGIIPSIGQLFAVTTANNGMQINVGTGRAWFDHTWNKNDSIMVLTVPLSDVTRSRYDAVVLEVNANDEIRTNSIKIVQGEPLVNPVKPVLVNTAKIHQYPLAYIKVEAGAEVIKASMIENMVGREPTVFATGVLEVVKIDALWEQWKGEWNDWFEDIKLQLSGNVATNLQYQIDQLKSGALTDSRKASSSEAIAGTNNTKWMTPSTTAAAIDANLGTVKDTYGNKASITVRNPATITWSKIGPIYEKPQYLQYAYGALRVELVDYIINFVVENSVTGRSPGANGNYLSIYHYKNENDYSLNVYMEIIKKSDFTYSRVYLGAASASISEAYYWFICAAIPETNKIIYSIGPYLRLATVTASSVTTNLTIESSMQWSTSSSARNFEVIVSTSKNYAVVSSSYRAYSDSTYSYTVMCNVNTYAHTNSRIALKKIGCVTNSGVYYGFEHSTRSSNTYIAVQEVDLNSWAVATYDINVNSYQSTFPPSGYGPHVFYDWIYDRIVFCIAATTANASQYSVWCALFNGRTMVNNIIRGVDTGVLPTLDIHDISSHTAAWGTTILTYTMSSITVRSITGNYGNITDIISGYGFIMSSNIVLPNSLASFTWLDTRIINDVSSSIVTTSKSPLGLLGLVDISFGRAYVLFKITNTVYIRD